MSMIPWGACASLHPVVQRAETLLSQAEGACATLRTIQSPGNASLVQLDQALIDGRTYIQREYDHLSNRYGSDKAAQGDQTARVDFGMICGTIEESITNPLEALKQHLQHHHGNHPSYHDHCHYCHEYHHHHSNHHHGHHHHGWALFVIGDPPHHHHNHNHNQLARYESRFQDMMNRWGTIKDNISSCFDSLEDRLNDKKGGEKEKSKDKDKEKVCATPHSRQCAAFPGGEISLLPREETTC